MSITNDAELQAAVANYLHRSDLTAQIPDFIVLAEAKLNRILRLRFMETIATGAIAASVALPDDFQEIISLTVSSGGVTYPITYTPPSSLTSANTSTYRYSIIGDNIYFEPSGSGETYTLTYYAKMAALSDGVNWLITNAPDVYLYATLLEAAPYIENMEKATVWKQYLEASVDMLNKSDKHGSYGTEMLVRVA